MDRALLILNMVVSTFPVYYSQVDEQLVMAAVDIYSDGNISSLIQVNP